MATDVLAAEGGVMLGSRLKRLAERLQAGAEVMARDCGLPTQPGQMPLLTALWRQGPLSIGEAAEATGFSQPATTRVARQLAAMGLVGQRTDDDDRRVQRLTLSAEGSAVMDRAGTALWPRIRAAVAETCDIEALLAQVAAVEKALAERPLDRRPGSGLAIRPFRNELAADFARINRQWIEEMYALEPVDEAQLADPRDTIVDPGADILFVEDPELGIVGTCGLLSTGPREFELIKMAVLPEARGRGTGEFLLRATIERAFALGAERLFLLTNSKSQAAIKLYERNGFVHDAELLARCGGEYARCDVAMLYTG
uniref:bifunctional helix-turn-helix transcriptional regulator/GNAT family N-acetyltransferase n=1 Tax=Altererythrobacter segetis TaxID=1104773 RepID=UPI0014077F0D|nr:bifunctional helix-turn-helix transcriptional regulator/GNAT family N-acetyltransferase [Altererythrobacter segetis]